METDYAFYGKDEFGEDETIKRNKRRFCYIGLTIFLILFDVFVQFTLFTSLYCLYFFASEETFIEMFQFFGMEEHQTT
jgi:hypothetical protein